MNELFNLSRLQEEESKKIAASINEPHQHDFEELIIGTNGVLEHFIDFKSEEINAPCVSFVTKGKIHRVIPKLKNGTCDFWVLRFKSEFIPETTFQLYSYYHGQANIPMKESVCFHRLVLVCEMINTETQQDIPDYSVIRHLLSALFTMIESERKKTKSQTQQ